MSEVNTTKPVRMDLHLLGYLAECPIYIDLSMLKDEQKEQGLQVCLTLTAGLINPEAPKKRN